MIAPLLEAPPAPVARLRLVKRAAGACDVSSGGSAPRGAGDAGAGRRSAMPWGREAARPIPRARIGAQAAGSAAPSAYRFRAPRPKMGNG